MLNFLLLNISKKYSNTKAYLKQTTTKSSTVLKLYSYLQITLIGLLNYVLFFIATLLLCIHLYYVATREVCSIIFFSY